MTLTARGFRFLVILFVSASIGALVYFDRNGDPEKVSAHANRLSLAHQNSLSRVWYCVGGSSDPQSPLYSTIQLVNLSGREMKVTVSFLSTGKGNAATTVVVPGNSTATVKPSEFVSATFTSAIVSADNQGLVAELATSSAAGISFVPCQTKLDGDWYFADGSTERDAALTSTEDNKTFLSILNPSTDAVSVDIDVVALNGDVEPADPNLAPEEDTRSPAEWLNLRLEPRSLTAIDVGSIIQRRVAMAIRVHADPGRIVVAESIIRKGSARTGIEILRGTTPSKQWYFAYGLADDSITERISTVNFTKSLSNAQVLMKPFYPTSGELPSTQAISRSVPPGKFDFFNVNKDGRVPKGIEHGWIVESNIPIVVCRSLDSSATRDFGQGEGIAQPAKEWLVPTISGDLARTISLANIGSLKAPIELFVVGNGSRTKVDLDAPIALSGYQRVDLSLAELGIAAGQSVLVRSSYPIIVEKVNRSVTASGFSVSPAIPIG